MSVLSRITQTLVWKLESLWVKIRQHIVLPPPAAPAPAPQPASAAHEEGEAEISNQYRFRLVAELILLLAAGSAMLAKIFAATQPYPVIAVATMVVMVAGGFIEAMLAVFLSTDTRKWSWVKWSRVLTWFAVVMIAGALATAVISEAEQEPSPQPTEIAAAAPRPEPSPTWAEPAEPTATATPAAPSQEPTASPAATQEPPSPALPTATVGSQAPAPASPQADETTASPQIDDVPAAGRTRVIEPLAEPTSPEIASPRSDKALWPIVPTQKPNSTLVGTRAVPPSPTPTNKPMLPAATEVPPTNTPVPPTATSTPTNTPLPPTATSTPTNTPVPPTATSTPTNTPVPPTATSTPTNTPVPPTATSTPTNTPVPPTATSTPTNTPVPPTATSTPTNTPVPPTATSTPTNTPVPPTATSTPTEALPTPTELPPTATEALPTPTEMPNELPASPEPIACPGYATAIYSEYGVLNAADSLCAKDELVAAVGLEPWAELILDFGLGNEIVDRAGYDLCYYELPKPDGGVLLDYAELSVASDDGDQPGAWQTPFIWGDGDATNNGSIPAHYPEQAEQKIEADDLLDGSGICIDIGNDDGQLYRFVRFRAYPADTQPGKDLGVEVDAVGHAPEGLPLPTTPTPEPQDASPEESASATRARW